jgi:acetyl-CoA carboxylase, biotin carboxylase subunit
MSFRRILIANRGEIASRIIRTCHALGIDTVLAASEADLDSVPAREAGATICIGPPPAARSYLDVAAVVRAAQAAKADAIHPGYGFLAENSRLATACAEAGLVFIGSTERQLELMGDKLAARAEAVAAGLPIVPGGAVVNLQQAQALTEQIGCPLLIKAVGGGGGRGIKPVPAGSQLAAALELASAEAGAAFGRAELYLERLVQRARHVEVQLLGDGRDVIHFGDRDCSVQRRYQKLIEEAPAPQIEPALREAMHNAAVALGRHLGYLGLGTVEFLFDSDRREFYFLEMNTRIQVEHPVTEAITGIDLVAEQISVAEGRLLRLRQQDVQFHGHAIECRINAEDSLRDFAPCPGRVTSATFPAGPGVRVDTHIEAGCEVPPFYDALLAKIIVHAANRDAAIADLGDALARCKVEGVETNLEFHRRVLRHQEFQAGGVDTQFLATMRMTDPAPLAAQSPTPPPTTELQHA